MVRDRRNWIAVASAEHVAIGRAEGFMQLCHGKAAPLRRLQAGDRVICYAPTATFGGTDRLRAFCAIGVVKPGQPFQVEMAGFRPFRRNVEWLACEAAPIAPLLEHLAFTAGRRNWGYRFRFGLFAVDERDVSTIATAMKAQLPDHCHREAAAQLPALAAHTM